MVFTSFWFGLTFMKLEQVESKQTGKFSRQIVATLTILFFENNMRVAAKKIYYVFVGS